MGKGRFLCFCDPLFQMIRLFDFIYNGVLRQFGKPFDPFIDDTMHAIGKMVAVTAMHLHAQNTIFMQGTFRRAWAKILTGAHRFLQLLKKTILKRASPLCISSQTCFHRLLFNFICINFHNRYHSLS